MNLRPFTGPGSTGARRRFWDQARAAVLGSQKIAGRFVTTSEHPGKGTVINVKSAAEGRRPGGGPTGACCVDGECSITTESACIALGGTYQGDGTDCDPDPCAIGACCYADCTCDDTITKTLCEAGGGTWHVGVACDPNPCPTSCCCAPVPITIVTTAETTRTLEGDDCRNWNYTAGPVTLTVTIDDDQSTCDFQADSPYECGDFNCDNTPYVSNFSMRLSVYGIDCDTRTFYVDICWFTGCINECGSLDFCALPDACNNYGPFNVDDHTATIDDTIIPELPSGTGSTTIHSELIW